MIFDWSCLQIYGQKIEYKW